MKTFRQFITEAPWINSDDLDNDEKVPSKVMAKQHEEQSIRIGPIGKHHSIYRRDFPGYDNTTNTHYMLVDDKTKHVRMGVVGETKGNKFFVSMLAGHTDGSTNGSSENIKAHEFYHTLITQHGVHLHSDYEQSTGGMKVWKALHKMPGIHMQSYNGSTEKYSELKPSFQRKYDMDSSTRLAAIKK